jgi:peptide deformylase
VIITDEKLLRVECEDVLPDEALSLRKKLEAELDMSFRLGRPGIGLACPQIGIAKNMAIVRIATGTGMFYNVDLVNCRIAESYDQAEFDGEGCLSFPDMVVKTLRYKEIKVVDNLVEPHEFVATGLFAVCIQHELDHLRGVLLPDLDISSQK